MSHLYVITKQEFTSLYRFGKIPLVSEKIINTKDKNTTEINNLVYNSFLSLPYFVGDEEYLIISFENNVTDGIWLGIENVLEIIPLTSAAKNSFEMKFDIKLEFKEARFEKVVFKVEEHIDIQERYRGAEVFWKLNNVDNEYEPLLPNDIIERAYQKRINGKKSNDFQDDFFIHLLAYDRYEFFPNTDLGYFYDVGEIFAHSKGLPSFRPTNFHSFLEKNKHELSDKPLIELGKIILENDETSRFTKKMTVNGLKQYIASAIFLKFKEDLREHDTTKDSNIGDLIRKLRKCGQFIDELNLAIFLTGSFFGYKKFYGDLYEFAGLKIFKPKLKQPQSEMNIKNEQIQSAKDLIESLTDVQDDEMVANDMIVVPDSKENAEVGPISNSVKVEVETPITATVSSSFNEYSITQNQILESLLTILEEQGSFEIKNNRREDLEKILEPLLIENKKTKISHLADAINDNFRNHIKVEKNGKKYTVSRNEELSL